MTKQRNISILVSANILERDIKMKRKKKIAYVSDACVACGCCVKECPLKAITIYKGVYAKVDEDKCVGCGKCAKACPAQIITIDFSEEVPYEEALV